MSTMQALRAHTRGGPETLVFEEAPVPVAGPGEILVEVHAAAITFAEFTWDETWQNADGSDRTPIIPSHEVSGVVAAVGDGVTEFAAGDEVYGRIRFDRDGAAAEYVVMEVEDAAIRPRSVGHVESAALPLAALTAWQALVDHARVQPGEHVLVRGASGGVGVYVVQLARILGASVSATARGSDLGLVLDLGADLVIDYADATDDNVLELADVVIDTVGAPSLARAFELVKPGGRLVTLTAPPPPELTEGRDVTATFFVVAADPGELRRIAELVDDGSLRPVVAQTFPLAEGRAAYEEGPRLHKAGKTVLVVRP
jgi:NADPH:quinone reductase-like Zn-dependent oxidoreductase